MFTRFTLTLLAAVLATGLVLAQSTDTPDFERLWAARDIQPLRDWVAGLDETKANQPEVLRMRARLALQDGEVETAEALIEQALELTNDASAIRPKLLFERANLRLSELDEAGMFSSLRIARRVREGFEAAVELDPDYMQAWFGVMQYHEQAPAIAGGRDARAAEARARLETLAPAHLQFHDALQIAGDQPETALTMMTEALDRAPDATSRPRWLLFRSSVLQGLERFDEASDLLEQALEEYPHHAGLWYQRGRLAAESGQDSGRGLDAMLRFNELEPWPGDPPPAAAWWRIGQLQQALGRIDGAREAFEYSLSLDPEFEESRQALDTLDGG